MEHHQITHHAVSRETFKETDRVFEKYREQLEAYLNRLLWWNKRVNLVSRNVPRETVREHLRHSLLLSQFDVFQSASTIVDAGTGGGLPGIPLAITHPDKLFVLNDIVSKKCLAMKQMIQDLGLKNAAVFDGSIENLKQQNPFLLISKHAFKINDLYEMTVHLPWQKMVLYKGMNFENELSDIDETLEIGSYDLSGESDFYKEKALIFIGRSNY
ncbi:MAG TPA: RsmG family class I SAM-dependent methyltransferase [Balneolaceae bacterium]|nr:RsmG family class I SAM-dependent methyltransferase [Balneolaceae bacterium]